MFDKKGMMLGERYELVGFIGKGGMSQVWKARHIHLDKFVAVKLLSKNLLDKEAFVARFKQEAQIASRLNHTNICSVFDFGFTEDNVPYIVMEFLEGESLADILKRIERLPVGASLTVVQQTLAGLSAAHKSGVVHRDIKPGNIFITKEKGGERVAKILDFGISKIVGKEKKDLALTSTGTLLGTAFYLSPEQIMESKGVDHRTDIYAMGAVLYKLVTGRVPYLGENYAEVAVKVVNDPLVDPRKLVEGLHAGVAKVIRKSMEKDTRSRYQSVDQMLADVAELVAVQEEDSIEALYKPGLESLILKPIEQKPPLLGRKGRIAVISVSIAVILCASAAAALLLMSMFGMWKGSGGSAGAVTAKEAAAAGKKEKSAVVVEEKALPVGGKVTVKFNAVPEGLRMIVGDEEISGNVLALDRSTSPVKITLKAEGYASREVTLVPVIDLELDGSLQLLPPGEPFELAAGGKPAGKKGKHGKGKKTTNGTTVTPVGEEKTEKDMDFIRDFPGTKKTP
jgi:tRNA A-37 threonylcarbamoyl transferase component Bud32